MSARELLTVADQIRSIATTGSHFAQSEFDRERYDRLLALAARLARIAGAGELSAIEQAYRDADAGYVTPKLDVRLAAFRAERVLLVRERSDGLWCLPGGYIDIGESPSEAAVREAAEEAGVATRVRALCGVFDNRVRPEAPAHLFQIYKLLFLGELIEPRAEPRAGREAEAAAFHPRDSLPELSRGRTLPFHIELAWRFATGETDRAEFD